MTRYPFAPSSRIGGLVPTILSPFRVSPAPEAAPSPKPGSNLRSAASAWLLTLTFLGLLGSPRAAAAQSEEALAAARETFMAGLDAMESAPPDYETAAEHFREVLLVRATPPVRLNLATCLVELFLFNEADEQVQEILEDAETDDGVRAAAAGLRERIESDGGRIAILLEGDVPTRFQLLLNDREVSNRLASRPLRVAPGPHRVSLEAYGAELVTRDVTITQGSTESLRIVVAEGQESAVVAVDQAEDDEGVPPETLAALATAPDDQEPEVVEETSITSDWRFWAVFAAGVVAVAGGAAAAGIIVSGQSEPKEIAPFRGDFSPTLIELGNF